MSHVEQKRKSMFMPRLLNPVVVAMLLCSTAFADEQHWSFRRITRPTPPRVRQSEWPRNGSDSFVLARLENENVGPSPDADRVTLIRRVTLDLIGLPPTPEEVAEFVQAERPDADERLVDRLLASPHYGERWARPWLDLCHYGDSDGHLTDQLRPVAWRYRDWLTRMLNDNLPFDEFTVRQIAGDLLVRGQALRNSELADHGVEDGKDSTRPIPNSEVPDPWLDRVLGGVAQACFKLGARSTRNLKPSVDERTAFNSIKRQLNVSWASGPRLEASLVLTHIFGSLRCSHGWRGGVCRDRARG